jgi:hypothetical protein
MLTIGLPATGMLRSSLKPLASVKDSTFINPLVLRISIVCL